MENIIEQINIEDLVGKEFEGMRKPDSMKTVTRGEFYFKIYECLGKLFIGSLRDSSGLWPVTGFLKDGNELEFRQVQQLTGISPVESGARIEYKGTIKINEGQCDKIVGGYRDMHIALDREYGRGTFEMREK